MKLDDFRRTLVPALVHPVNNRRILEAVHKDIGTDRQPDAPGAQP